MSLKQSCFKSVVKCDLKRSWWISALAALFIFMSSTSPIFSYEHYYSYSRYDNMLDFCEMMFGNYIIGMGLAGFVVLYLFSYLNKVNSVSFFHSLPTTRNGLISAHLVSSAILVVSPMLINSIITLFAVGKGIGASWIVVSFLMYVLYSFVAMAITLIVSMLTGVSIASGIFSVILALLPLFIFTFISELCADYLYGFNGYGNLMDFLVEYVYLPPEAILSWKSVIYVLLVAVFVALSYFIYNKRHLENHGEVIAFTSLRGLFKVLFGLCAGVLGYYYFEAFWGITSILTMLVFGILGVIIAHMISNRSISLRGVLVPLLVTIGMIILLFVSFFFDIFGFEKRIPDIDDIEYACIDGLYYQDYSYVDSDVFGEGRIRVKEKDPYIPNYVEKEDLERFIELHKYAVEHQHENDAWDDDIFTPSYKIAVRDHVSIEYKLKNGSVMTRSYSLPADELYKLKGNIYNTDVYRKWKFPIIDGKPKVYKSVTVFNELTYIHGDGIMLSASSDDAKRIIEAIKKDRSTISYDRMLVKDVGSFLITVSLDYTTIYVSDDGREFPVEQSDTYSIDKYDVNTWRVLEELDLFKDEKMLKSADIDRAYINVGQVHRGFNYDGYIDDYYYPEAVTEEVVYSSVMSTKYYNGEKGFKEFTSREDIEILFDLFANHVNDVIDRDEEYLSFTLTLDSEENISRGRTIQMRFSELPEILNYLNDIK